MGAGGFLSRLDPRKGQQMVAVRLSRGACSKDGVGAPLDIRGELRMGSESYGRATEDEEGCIAPSRSTEGYADGERPPSAHRMGHWGRGKVPEVSEGRTTRSYWTGTGVVAFDGGVPPSASSRQKVRP